MAPYSSITGGEVDLQVVCRFGRAPAGTGARLRPQEVIHLEVVVEGQLEGEESPTAQVHVECRPEARLVVGTHLGGEEPDGGRLLERQHCQEVAGLAADCVGQSE